MSAAHELCTTALSAVLANTWAVELPPGPTYPALLFELDTQTEDQWCIGGGYDQHTLTVLILSETLEYVDTVRPLIRAAIEALPIFMFEDASGDADYEDDPNIYAHFMTFRLRTSRM